MTQSKRRARRWVFRELDRLGDQRLRAGPKEQSLNPENCAKTRET